MSGVYLSYNNIFCNLGFDSEAVVQNIYKGVSGIHKNQDPLLLPQDFCASTIASEDIQEKFKEFADPTEFTRLEQMMILSLKQVIDASRMDLDRRVGLLISTTKGNIDVLDKSSDFPESRAYLSELGRVVHDFFKFKNEAMVISNACVSGILAVSVAQRFIAQGKYDHVFVVGGDLVTQFTLSGFNSFQALSPEPCKPYDKNRVGINLGEAAASVLVTAEKNNLSPEAVEILGGATCNDANHISGPSRTGEGLYRSVESALNEAGVDPSDIDYISAHGTATPFNDEMEAIAFNRLSMENIPLNSLKGYFGHTLGASGLLETVVGMHSLYRNTLFSSKGYDDLGVSKALNIIEANRQAKLDTFLKTASGFGGCNTAIIFRKPTD